MKQITDKLNKIAKAIDENVELPTTDLITDSLDAITKALGGTPNDSNLIVDKLEDIAGVATKGGEGGGHEAVLDTTSFTSEYDEEANLNVAYITLEEEPSWMGVDTIYVTYDGQEYALPKIDDDLAGNAYGEIVEGQPTFENYPLFISGSLQSNDIVVITSEAGEHEIKIEVEPIIPKGQITLGVTPPKFSEFSETFNVFNYAAAKTEGRIMPACTVRLKQASGMSTISTITFDPVITYNGPEIMEVDSVQINNMFGQHIHCAYPSDGKVVFNFTTTALSVNIANTVNCTVEHQGITYTISITDLEKNSFVAFDVGVNA